MRNNVVLTEGKIGSALVKLALPIMGTSFINMAYNLTDIDVYKRQTLDWWKIFHTGGESIKRQWNQII